MRYFTPNLVILDVTLMMPVTPVIFYIVYDLFVCPEYIVKCCAIP